MTSTGGVWRSWDLTPAHFEDSQRRIGGITARAGKAGFTGRVRVAGRARIGRVEDLLLGVFEVVTVRAWLEGTPARYGGWEILAEVEGLSGGGTRLHPAAGATRAWDVVAPAAAAGVCEHCGTGRARRTTFLVAREGERAGMYVGKSCTAAVVGVSRPMFLGELDVAERLGWGLDGQGWSPAFTVPTVLALAYAGVAALGWDGVIAVSRRVGVALAGREDAASMRLRELLSGHMDAGRAWAGDMTAGKVPGRSGDPVLGAVAPWGVVTAHQVPVLMRGVAGALRHVPARKVVMRGVAR